MTDSCVEMMEKVHICSICVSHSTEKKQNGVIEDIINIPKLIKFIFHKSRINRLIGIGKHIFLKTFQV